MQLKTLAVVLMFIFASFSHSLFVNIDEMKNMNGSVFLNVDAFSPSKDKVESLLIIPEFKGMKTERLFNLPESLTKGSYIINNRRVRFISTDGSIKIKEIKDGISIKPVNASRTILILKARKELLFKCKEWDFDKEECLGTWKFVRRLTPGKDYIIEVYKNDPAFVEVSPFEANDSNGFDVTGNVSNSDDVYAINYGSSYSITGDFLTGLTQSDEIDSAEIGCELSTSGGWFFDSMNLYIDFFNKTDSTWYTVCSGSNLALPTSDTTYYCDVTEVAQINKSNQTYRCRMTATTNTNWYVDYFYLSVNGKGINSCGTYSRSNTIYFLNKNLTSNGTCIEITGENVSLYCNNNWIKGNGSGYGIFVNDAKNVSLIGCNVSGFLAGSFLYFSSYSSNLPAVINSTFWNNTYGIYGYYARDGYFNNITFFNNSAGAWFHIADYSNFSNLYFCNNTHYALSLNWTCYTNLTKNAGQWWDTPGVGSRDGGAWQMYDSILVSLAQTRAFFVSF